MHKIFKKILDYQFEKFGRNKNENKYKKFNEAEGIDSSVFVVNSKSSAISSVIDNNEYMDKLFNELIEEYRFPVDRAAIYYLFDRDIKSNTNSELIKNLIASLNSSLEVNELTMYSGLLLLSYPSIESFTASNFIDNSFELQFETGKELKQALNQRKINHSNITADSLLKASHEMIQGLEKIDIHDFNLDDFTSTNERVFEFQEHFYKINKNFRCLSLLTLILIDLGIIQVDKDT